MRFRSVATKPVLTWLGLALFWIVISIASLREDLARHNSGRAEIHVVTLAAWLVIFIVYLYLFFFNRLEIEPTALRIGGGFRPRRIPYDNIVAVRPVLSDKGNPLRNQIELETARLIPSIYPHDYLRLAVSDPNAFICAVRDKAPHIESEPF